MQCELEQVALLLCAEFSLYKTIVGPALEVWEAADVLACVNTGMMLGTGHGGHGNVLGLHCLTVEPVK